MTFTHALSTNRYGEGDLIVSTSASNGTHVTLASAMSAATSGQTIFLRDSVTENVTLTAGVNISAWNGGSLNTPTIIGTLTMTAAGTCNISGIRLQTNSAALLAVTGSAASIVNLHNCFLNCANNTGITFSSSSASAVINITKSKGALGTTGIGLFTHTSAGVLLLDYFTASNTGGSSTASTCSAGILNMQFYNLQSPITLSGTGACTFEHGLIDTATQNVTALTLGGGSQTVKWSRFTAGTASAVSIGTTAGMEFCTISSSNTNAITGAGTLLSGYLSFDGTTNVINTTTQTPIVSRFGVQLSGINPAFSAYLGATVLNKTGTGTSYTLGTDALTEAYDQGANFNTNGTFTAPYTGKYQLSCGCLVTGCTIASTNNFSLVTSNRSYVSQNARPAGASNINAYLSSLADMDAADTATVVVSVVGEAGDTDDIFGAAAYDTFFNGILLT